MQEISNQGPAETSDRQKPHRLIPTVADLMMMVFALSLAMGLIRMHLDEPTLQFRFRSGAPTSLTTRLLLGHLMTGFGLVFGISQFVIILWKERESLRFGSYFWSITGLYLIVHVSASVVWSLVNQIAKWNNGQSMISLQLASTLKRVMVLTSNQACFDEFAAVMAAIWLVGGVTFLFGRIRTNSDRDLIDDPVAIKSDVSFALYSGFVMMATIFQRLLEAVGF